MDSQNITPTPLPPEIRRAIDDYRACCEELEPDSRATLDALLREYVANLAETVRENARYHNAIREETRCECGHDHIQWWNTPTPENPRGEKWRTNLCLAIDCSCLMFHPAPRPAEAGDAPTAHEKALDAVRRIAMTQNDLGVARGYIEILEGRLRARASADEAVREAAQVYAKRGHAMWCGVWNGIPQPCDCGLAALRAALALARAALSSSSLTGDATEPSNQSER